MAVTVALIIGAYLLGAVPFSWLVARACGVDLRSVGSGNIGAANVWRSCGFGPFLAAMTLDALKGALPTLLALRGLGASPLAAVTVGCAAILGHSFPIYLRFRGGKAVATAGGVLLALAPWLALLGVAVWVVAFALSRISAVGSLAAALACALAAGAQLSYGALPLAYAGFIWAASGLILLLHRDNIARLRAGTERRFRRAGRLPQSHGDTEDAQG